MQILAQTLKILSFLGCKIMKNKNTIKSRQKITSKNSFSAYEHFAKNATKVIDASHNHDFHELFLLLDGSLDYFAEGNIFPMAPMDCIIIGSGIPHGKNMSHTPNLKFFVLLIENSFFEKNNCSDYKNIFIPQNSTDHKISADECQKSGLIDAYQRLKKYTDDFRDIDTPIANSVVIEILHILNNHTHFSESYIENKQVQRIFDYINNNYKDKITLESISNSLFMSRYHVCKLFKKYVGITVYKYITQKRIEYTKHLVASGKSITSSCVEAGFSDYSSFYKAYIKETGSSPKKTLSQKS